MTFGADEPEMYEHAQDTRFRTLANDIAADPSGRGRVPAASPLEMRPAPADDPDMAFTEREVAARTSSPEQGDPYERDNFTSPPPQPASPVALLSGGRKQLDGREYNMSGGKNPRWDVQIGDATITREPPAPPEPESAPPEPESANAD